MIFWYRPPPSKLLLALSELNVSCFMLHNSRLQIELEIRGSKIDNRLSKIENRKSESEMPAAEGESPGPGPAAEGESPGRGPGADRSRLVRWYRYNCDRLSMRIKRKETHAAQTVSFYNIHRISGEKHS